MPCRPFNKLTPCEWPVLCRSFSCTQSSASPASQSSQSSSSTKSKRMSTALQQFRPIINDTLLFHLVQSPRVIGLLSVIFFAVVACDSIRLTFTLGAPFCVFALLFNLSLLVLYASHLDIVLARSIASSFHFLYVGSAIINNMYTKHTLTLHLHVWNTHFHSIYAALHICCHVH